MKPIIKVENLSKQYRIGVRQKFGTTFRDAFAEAVKTPLKRLRHSERMADEMWALKNIDFDVMPGEVVGIIGRNGAGKSTLLKILSRITEPTAGRVELYGRVGSRQKFNWTALALSTVVTLSLLVYSAYSFRRMDKSFADLV